MQWKFALLTKLARQILKVKRLKEHFPHKFDDCLFKEVIELATIKRNLWIRAYLCGVLL